MTNRDNILMPLVLANRSHKVMERMNTLSSKLGIEKLLSKYPYQVSGGEQQRIAIGRALINEPDLLLADEPTGALDSKTSKQIMTLFREINDNTQTILMVTHSTIDASYAKQYYLLKMDVCIMKFTEGRIATRFPKAYRDSLAILNESGD